MTFRILAVDDTESNLVALEAVLQESSVSLVRARSGEDALRALLKEDFSLVLLDVQMPGMDGFDTANAIRQRPRTSKIPIIFLTAYGSGSEKLARAYAVGAVDFLTKPYDPEALRAKVKAIADLWRKVDDTRAQAAEEGERRLREERLRWEAETLRGRVAEQEQRSATEHAARLDAETENRLKDEFLATLSHELRTPLNAILGWATLLKRKGVTDPAMVRGLDAIERNATLQAKLIEDLLDTSRIVAGKIRLEFQSTPVAELITAVADAIRPLSDGKRITVDVVVEDGLPATICDPERIQQALTNVLSNAVKFTPDGGRIDVRVERIESSLRIQIRDTGVGIARDFLPHVFDRFRQRDGTSTRAQGGLGIGLSLAQRLIAMHGGTISVDSEGEGKGALFTISLPIHRAGTQVTERPQNLGHSPPPASLQDVRVLVVDDEVDARDLVREILENAGAVVLAVDSADRALDAFAAWKPDVIISDIAMPQQDGYALIRRIRALPGDSGKRVPAAALTAYASADDVAQARSAGFQSHVAKPIDAARLVSTVAALVGRAS